MGNESSKLKGLVIDKNAVEANDFWALFNAESPTTSNEEGRQLLSIFQGEPVVTGQLWVAQGPMERAIKNLMIYRHPYILKYVTTWEQGGQKHLATERVRPLVAVMSTQSDIQVCLGLRTVLCSLIFLIEKAMARHLNICTASIYITDNGSWRLAGFEYVWKSKEVTKTLLDLANAYRYQPAIDASETKDHNSDFIEQYAFATLCEEILAKCTKSETATPFAQEFRDYCTTHLKHKQVQMRPKLSAVLLHPYFNHEFVLIHSFLFELPLKSLQEKQDFFSGLIDRLSYFQEEVVGAQLAADLLSRMVLLDPTAQLCVTPYVLKTKTDHSSALFSNGTYTRHLMPHILKMFRLRDAQIRLILLEYFMEFVRLLTRDELEELILPHLLAGMNDTNDVLVAKTLRCLADLVPILGAAKVIGGQRLRLFSDGRPQAAVHDATQHWVEPRSITPVMGSSVMDYMVSGSPLPPNDLVDLSGSFNSLPQVTDNGTETANDQQMPQRLSPDGGEDDKSIIIADRTEATEIAENVVDRLIDTLGDTDMSTTTNHIEKTSAKDDDEDWSDWETDELQRLHAIAPNSNELPTSDNSETLLPVTSSSSNLKTQSSEDLKRNSIQSNSASNSQKPNKINDDLSTLDINVQRSNSASTQAESAEFDFFKDMEPIIVPKCLSLDNAMLDNIPLNKTSSKASHEEEIVIDSSRFAAVDGVATSTSLDGAADGWGVDDDDVENWHA